MSDGLYRKLQVLESEERPLDRISRLEAMTGPLLAWYREHARILPWREEPEPYRVWVSEIMLQQTRVEAVKPYFARFMEALPDVKALAAVPDDRLMKLWEGLGYYNRARNLKKAAQIIVNEYGGRLPDTKEELLKLPGIGSYTAGAVASIAYGKREAAVDGNVLRVISRVLASREDIASQPVKRQFEEDLVRVMPAEDCSAFNQGLIEIGALVCVPNGEPRCGECPLRSVCLAARNGLTGEIPYKAPKKPRRIEERTILLIESGDLVAIQKRPEKGLLASMYEFPGLEGTYSREEVWAAAEEWFRTEGSAGATPAIRSVTPAPDAVHIFSHVEWHMTGYRLEADHIPARFLAVSRREISEKYALPSAFDRYIKLINGKS